MLCDICKVSIQLALNAATASGYATQPQHPGPGTFEASVHAGCVLCISMFRQTEKRGLRSATRCTTTANGVPHPEAFTYVKLYFNTDDLKIPLESQEFIICVSTMNPDVESNLSKGPSIWFHLLHASAIDHLGPTIQPYENNAPTILKQVKTWFKKCQAEHEICRARRFEPWFPSRLLSLLEYADGNLRLVDTASEKLEGFYVTLSHRWGADPCLRLQTRNEDLLKRGLYTRDLPLSFQDAAQVAVHLGASYIWIDSLCIKQDSPEDWERESSQMGNIYKNAECNIGATGATDEHTGFGFNRNPTDLEVGRLQLSVDGETTTFYAMPLNLWSKLSEEPLNNRAWVLQERHLAPSMVHFGTHKVFWECYGLNACQSFPSGIPSRFYPSTLRNHQLCPDAISLQRFERSESVFNPEDPRIRALERWGDLCVDYMRCGITKPGDKLVAMSGLAKEFQALIKARYLAGLWDYNFVPQLLWAVSTRVQPRLPRPLLYRAPSWSWASIEGEIEHAASGYLGGLLVDVIDIKIEHSGNDPTGAVASSQLRLRACVFLLKLISLEKGIYYGRGYEAEISITLDTFAILDELSKCLLFCMPLQQCTEYDTDENEGFSVEGLILQRVEQASCCYRRVGVFDERVDVHESPASTAPVDLRRIIEIM